MSQHPAMIPLNLAGIPAKLRSRDQWVCWRWEVRVDKNGADKWTKVPINARTGALAATDNPDTWNAYSAATYYWQKHANTVHGIGFVFSASDPFTGIDLDSALDPETKKLRPEALAIIDRFDSFTEWSISGTGAHIYIEGELPPDGRRRGKIEMYDRERFFVVSGNVIQNPNLIGDRSDELQVFHRETFPEQYAPKVERTGPLSTEPLDINDDELLKRCEGSEKFRRLNAGDDSGYDDDTSRADLAYCNSIVRNGGTRAQVDSLYRRSSRARDKWDTKRGTSTYGEMTLDEAFDGTIQVYERHEQPSVRVNPQDAGLLIDDLPDDLPSLKAIIIDLRTRMIVLENRVVTAEERAEKLSQLQSKTTGILRNKNLGQERFTAVALAYQLGNKESTGDGGDNGLHRMPLKRIAESAGVSEDTASKHLQKLEKEGVIRRTVKWVPSSVNQQTGEIIDAHKALFVGTVTNVTDFVEAVARLAPEAPKKWGGSRIQCPDHPNADVIKRTSWHCAECDELLNADVETLRPKPQDAELLDLAATGTDDPQTQQPIPRVVRQLGYVSDTASHNNSVASAWMQGKPLPSPIDQGVPF